MHPRPSGPTSMPDLTNAFVPEWPHNHIPKSTLKSSHKSGGNYISKWGGDVRTGIYLLLPMGVIVRWPQTFGHIMHAISYSIQKYILSTTLSLSVNKSMTVGEIRLFL